jgi:hypothetical protein
LRNWGIIAKPSLVRPVPPEKLIRDNARVAPR